MGHLYEELAEKNQQLERYSEDLSDLLAKVLKKTGKAKANERICAYASYCLVSAFGFSYRTGSLNRVQASETSIRVFSQLLVFIIGPFWPSLRFNKVHGTECAASSSSTISKFLLHALIYFKSVIEQCLSQIVPHLGFKRQIFFSFLLGNNLH